ncbi:hypothetical protein [Pseudomarimonas salicorniae]|uniref:Uncharacterized protein n=1 Tax=Pseudomarimonas salicorniae TaxID=2933270 RepID=A0ABT0GI41_9GAMM|nr:hypothetical protein [Lysobacter sp. CAU 1642]MCK7594221.1 hypothetical protein [Lysobacter sp. CAU 1642]
MTRSFDPNHGAARACRGLLAALLLLAVAPAMAAADKAQAAFVGFIDVRLDLEFSEPSIGGQCAYFGRASLQGHGPEGEWARSRPRDFALLAPCGLPLRRLTTRAELAVLGLARSAQRVSVEQAAGLVMLPTGNGRVQGFITFGAETTVLFVPGPEAEIVFDAESEQAVSLPYPPGVGGFGAFGAETSVLYVPGPEGFVAFGHETSL